MEKINKNLLDYSRLKLKIQNETMLKKQKEIKWDKPYPASVSSNRGLKEKEENKLPPRETL